MLPTRIEKTLSGYDAGSIRTGKMSATCIYCCNCYGSGGAGMAGSGLSMNTSPPNLQVCASPGGTSGDGGASSLQAVLNSVGRWGTAVTGIVAGSKVQGAQIQARTVTQTANTGAFTLIVIVVIVALLIYEVMK